MSASGIPNWSSRPRCCKIHGVDGCQGKAEAIWHTAALGVASHEEGTNCQDMAILALLSPEVWLESSNQSTGPSLGKPHKTYRVGLIIITAAEMPVLESVHKLAPS